MACDIPEPEPREQTPLRVNGERISRSNRRFFDTSPRVSPRRFFRFRRSPETASVPVRTLLRGTLRLTREIGVTGRSGLRKRARTAVARRVSKRKRPRKFGEIRDDRQTRRRSDASKSRSRKTASYARRSFDGGRAFANEIYNLYGSVSRPRSTSRNYNLENRARIVATTLDATVIPTTSRLHFRCEERRKTDEEEGGRGGGRSGTARCCYRPKLTEREGRSGDASNERLRKEPRDTRLSGKSDLPVSDAVVFLLALDSAPATYSFAK